MSWEKGRYVHTRKVDASMADRLYTFVVLNADSEWAHPGAAGARCDAVMLNEPTTAGYPGEAALISKGGIIPVCSNGSIEAGKQVSCAGTTGKAREAVSGDYVLGVAQEGDGGVDNAYIPVALSDGGVMP